MENKTEILKMSLNDCVRLSIEKEAELDEAVLSSNIEKFLPLMKEINDINDRMKHNLENI